MVEQVPQSFIEDLLARIDIVELINARVTLRKQGNNYSALCPFHNEKTPSFTVSQPKQFYYCFGCGAKGNAISFLMQYERLEFLDALETLASKAGVVIPHSSHDSPTTSNVVYYSLLHKAAQLYQAALKQSASAIDYLKSRGVTGQMAKQFLLGYAPSAWETLNNALGTTPALREQLVSVGLTIKKNKNSHYDRFRDRIIFPLRDVRGRIIAFGGRNLGPQLPKYLNSPETPIFHKGSELYGLYEARQAYNKLEKIIIVEGYMDVIALVQFGIPYVAATLGTAITVKHIQKLQRYTSEIIFCFDGDAAGKKAAWRALENTLPSMQNGLKIMFMFLPQGEDPDSYVRRHGEAGFLQLLTNAQTLSDFFFEHLMEQGEIKTPDGKARLVALAKNWLDKIPRGIFQQLMFEKLAQLIQFDTLAAPSLSTYSAVKSEKRQLTYSVLSPFKLAMILLLQHPELASTVTQIDFLKIFNTKDADNLFKLFTLLQKNPQLTVGALLEHWRDSEDADHLTELATYEHPAPLEGIEEEFKGALNRIQDVYREQIIQLLLEKARQQGLSDTEKLQLQTLISGAH